MKERVQLTSIVWSKPVTAATFCGMPGGWMSFGVAADSFDTRPRPVMPDHALTT